METCADCGKPIYLAGWTQNDPWGKGGPSKHFHAGCGDPLGIKAKDAVIERLMRERDELRAALKGVEIALARDGDVSGAMKIILAPEQSSAPVRSTRPCEVCDGYHIIGSPCPVDGHRHT